MDLLPADKVCSGKGTLALTPQCLRVLHESFERILSRLDNHAINGSLPVSLNEFAGYRELSFMYDIVQLASSLKVSKVQFSLHSLFLFMLLIGHLEGHPLPSSV